MRCNLNGKRIGLNSLVVLKKSKLRKFKADLGKVIKIIFPRGTYRVCGFECNENDEVTWLCLVINGSLAITFFSNFKVKATDVYVKEIK